MLIGNLLKSRKLDSLNREVIREQAAAALTLMGGSQDVLDKLVDDLSARFDVFIQRAAILVDDSDHVRWAKSADRSSWRFWPRCEKYLLGYLPEPVVRQIDEDTDRILELLGDPSNQQAWDRKGLVVGEVQFGKTSNYSALACKAVDAGYRIIIVLAGLHESLRMQTQIRMDEAFLGFKTDSSRAPIGVGLFDSSVPVYAATARSVRGDFNKIISNQLTIPLSGPPILLVVKKNAMMLSNLLAWLEKIGTRIGHKRIVPAAPALIIDDESDNASVDTAVQAFNNKNQPDLSHTPTRINELIRKIVDVFEKRSYVGYTATPFANIFIHHEGETTKAAKDLFPRNFIVNLHAPSNYFGPIQAFGLEESGDDVQTGAALVRLVDDDPIDREELTAWMPAKHKSDHIPGSIGEDGFPKSLRRALLSFILVCAVRKLRGQAAEHNSMLVHVTRFTRIQELVFNEIEDSLVRIRRRLRYGDEGTKASVKDELRNLWFNDFSPTTEAMRGYSDTGQLPDWRIVEPTLAHVASGIRIKQVNGLAQDVLDYDSYKDQGIDVIVVGGDKLSRGLTLYGLSVSYFIRQSDMYDTLLQMGRWFGYRPGYLDLCRLYTTQHLNDAFEHIALASDGLRREFDYMESVGKKPIEYGLKVLSHKILRPTARGKRRHARDIVLYLSYDGIISETKSFSLKEATLEKNNHALEFLAESLLRMGDPESPCYGSDETHRDYRDAYLWRGIPTAIIQEFLDNYETEPSAIRANSVLWNRYIRSMVKDHNELTQWNVAFINGPRTPEKQLGKISLGMRLRKRDTAIIAERAEGYQIKRLITPRDAGVDLPVIAWNEAKSYDSASKLNGQPRTEPTSSAISRVRHKLGLNPLLMIYLPTADDLQLLKYPVVGVAISFPGTDHPKSYPIRYTANSVFLGHGEIGADGSSEYDSSEED